MIKGINEVADSKEKYIVTIDNGDLELINSLVEAYSFLDKDSLIKFAIAALIEGNNNEGLFTIKSSEDDGRKVLSKITPPVDLLNVKQK